MRLVKCPCCDVTLFYGDQRAATCGRCGEPLTGGVAKPTCEHPRGTWLQSLLSWGRRETKQIKAAPSKTGAVGPTASVPETAETNLRPKIERLVKLAWGTLEQVTAHSLAVSGSVISVHQSHAQFVSTLLQHVHHVAPGLSVPIMTPAIVQEPLCDAAGQFVETDGWVKIVVGAGFFNDLPTARAILCHELCHYILGANGIREVPRDENERLTDVAMFVFGLGEIFLQGYRRQPGINYRTGHRLGYLADEEYELVNEHVRRLRRTGELQRSTLDVLETRLKAVVPNAQTRNRLIANYKQKHPAKAPAQLIQFILDQIAKDNR